MTECQSQLSFNIILKNTDDRARALLHAHCQRAWTCLPGHQINIVDRISAHSAGAYIATLLVMVNVMKGGERAPPSLTSLG